MSIIDETYFAYEPCYLGEFNSARNDAKSEKLNKVRRSIARFEPKYLELLMGEELYAEYVSTITNGKWQPLIAKLRDAENKISPIANYVYYYHRHENKYTSGDNGDFTPKMDNHALVDVSHKMINAWNEMVYLNAKVMKWILDNIINAETPAIETTATWDYSQWEECLLHKQNGYL